MHDYTGITERPENKNKIFIVADKKYEKKTI